MAPLPLQRLTAGQATRMASIKQMGTRMKERTRDRLNKNILKARIDSVTSMWDEACKTHAEIVAREDSAEDAYISENIFAQLQEVYEETWDLLLTMQLDFEEASGSGISSASTAVTVDEAVIRSAKLPKLDLPTFTGRYEDWPNFCGLFTNLVHKVPGIAESVKLQYLKLCLKGEAADFIKHVDTTDDNYASTWKAVSKRYYNPRRVVNKHLDTLLELEHIRRESAGNLKDFVDKIQGALRALKSLGMPIDQWDAWLIRVVSSRLDGESRKLWEAELSSRDASIRNEVSELRDEQSRKYQFPKFKELIDFLEQRVETLSMSVEVSGSARKASGIPIKSPGWSPNALHVAPRATTKGQWNKCPSCNGVHALYSCRKFQALTPVKRREEVRRWRRCYNCFGNHRADVCPSNVTCTKCKRKHHVSLHIEGTVGQEVRVPESKVETKVDPSPADRVSTRVHTVRKVDAKSIVLLATARVGVSSPGNRQTLAKVFIDAGSQVSMITEDLAQRLKLSRRKTEVPLTGLGGADAGIAKSAAEVTVHSLIEPSACVTVEFLVRKRLTDKLPSRNLYEADLSEFSGLPLADPHFDKSETIDIIIGADIEGHFVKPGLRKSSSSALIARNTILGWVFSGPPPMVCARRAEPLGALSAQSCHVAVGHEVQEVLLKFWELEEIPTARNSLSVEDRRCEEQFVEIHSRDGNGRFMVRLPLRCRPSNTNVESRRIAMGSLTSVHRKFVVKPDLAKAYKDFMQQYIDLGHMSPVPVSELKNPNAWYLPHHAVAQERPEGLKIRVVFDAARKLSDGKCLNDYLMPGPPLQGDLALILLNW